MSGWQIQGPPEDTKELFRVPKKHPRLFAAIYLLPAILNITATCIIYRFNLVCGISLVWCYLTGSFLIKGYYEGQLFDNHGSAIRKTMPFQFWAKMAVWIFAYLFALSMPIAFAIQEHNGMVASSTQTVTQKPAP